MTMNALNGVQSDTYIQRTIIQKYFAKKLDYKDIYKIEKKNSIGISPFGYKNRENHPNYVSKKCC